MRLEEGQIIVFPSYVIHEVSPFYGRDVRITKYLPPKELEAVFDLQRQLRNVDKLFDRVFGAHPAGERGIANKA